MENFMSFQNSNKYSSVVSDKEIDDNLDASLNRKDLKTIQLSFSKPNMFPRSKVITSTNSQQM